MGPKVEICCIDPLADPIGLMRSEVKDGDGPMSCECSELAVPDEESEAIDPIDRTLMSFGRFGVCGVMYGSERSDAGGLDRIGATIACHSLANGLPSTRRVSSWPKRQSHGGRETNRLRRAEVRIWRLERLTTQCVQATQVSHLRGKTLQSTIVGSQHSQVDELAKE